MNSPPTGRDSSIKRVTFIDQNIYNDDQDVYYKGSFNYHQNEDRLTKKNSLAVLPQYNEYEANLGNLPQLSQTNSTKMLIKTSPQTANKHRDGSHGSHQRERSGSSGHDSIKVSKDNRNIVILKAYLISIDKKTESVLE